MTTKDLVFAHDTLTRHGEFNYTTADILNHDELTAQDVRAWAKAAFANSSSLTSISLYVDRGKTVHAYLILMQKIPTGRNPDRLVMQNSLTHAMLPIESTTVEQHAGDQREVDDACWQTTFLNSAFWNDANVQRSKGYFTEYRIDELPRLTMDDEQCSNTVTLATFNQLHPVVRPDGTIIRRTSPLKLMETCMSPIELWAPNAKVYPVRAKVAAATTGEIGIYSELPMLGTIINTMGACVGDVMLFRYHGKHSTHTVIGDNGIDFVEYMEELTKVTITGVII